MNILMDTDTEIQITMSSPTQLTLLWEAAAPLVARQEAVIVLVTCHQIWMQAGLQVIVVNDLDLRFVQGVAVVGVNLAELPHDRPEAVTVAPSWRQGQHE